LAVCQPSYGGGRGKRSIPTHNAGGLPLNGSVHSGRHAGFGHFVNHYAGYFEVGGEGCGGVVSGQARLLHHLTKQLVVIRFARPESVDDGLASARVFGLKLVRRVLHGLLAQGRRGCVLTLRLALAALLPRFSASKLWQADIIALLLSKVVTWESTELVKISIVSSTDCARLGRATSSRTPTSPSINSSFPITGKTLLSPTAPSLGAGFMLGAGLS